MLQRDFITLLPSKDTKKIEMVVVWLEGVVTFRVGFCVFIEKGSDHIAESILSFVCPVVVWGGIGL